MMDLWILLYLSDLTHYKDSVFFYSYEKKNKFSLPLNKIIIASVSLNGVIGRDGKIPWNSKSDLKHFRETTLNYPVIMGRLTFESIGGVLDRRINIVLSRNIDSPLSSIPGIILCTSLDNAYEFCRMKKYDKIFIIGGAQIFSQTIDKVNELLISRINLNLEGDAEFPEIKQKIWELDFSKKFDDFKLQKYVKVL